MADVHLYTHLSAEETVDGDSGWVSGSAVTQLSVDLDATAVAGPTDAIPNVAFYLERKEPDGSVYGDWQAVLDGPQRYNFGVGQDLDVNVAVGDLVRLRWVLNDGACTFAASIVGRA